MTYVYFFKKLNNNVIRIILMFDNDILKEAHVVWTLVSEEIVSTGFACQEGALLADECFNKALDMAEKLLVYEGFEVIEG
jgi:hypothetical protein